MPASQPVVPVNDIVLHAELLKDRPEGPAKGGKSIKFIVDGSIANLNRDPNARHIRIKIGEENDFVRGVPITMPLVSYANQERPVLIWGKRSPLSDDGDETFQFTSFVKVAVYAIEEDDKETRILGFTLLPKISGIERMTETTNRGVAIGPEPTWRNFLVCQDGTLSEMDSRQ